MVMVGVDPDAEARALGQFGEVAAPYEPGTFTGLASAVGSAAPRLAAKIPLAVGMGAAGLTWLADKEAGYSMFRSVDDLYGKAVDYWTPDAHTTGVGAQVVGSLAEIVPALFAGPAALPILAGTATATTGRQLAQEGVDGGTAGVVAGIQGAATAVGFAAPAAVGRTLAQRVVSGAAINTAVGTSADAASAAALESGGYEQQAEQFAPTNLTNRSLDVLIGAAFGAAAHMRAPKDFDQRIGKADRDAILTVANNEHLVNNTGPGRPVTPMDAGKQTRNMESAVEQLLTTGRVDAAALPETDITFARTTDNEPAFSRESITEELRANGQLHDLPEVEPDTMAGLLREGVAPEIVGGQSVTELPTKLSESPEVADTLAAVEADPDLAAFRITDADGNESSIGDIVQTAIKESDEAEGLTAGFKAAASCFLRSLK